MFTKRYTRHTPKAGKVDDDYNTARVPRGESASRTGRPSTHLRTAVQITICAVPIRPVRRKDIASGHWHDTFEEA